MNLKNVSLIKNKLGKYLKDKDILDVILFGSVIKGKSSPSDIDIAMITQKEIKADISGFHISVLKPEDFFVSPSSLVNTLLREGFSIKSERFFSEKYKFLNRVMFVYELKDLNPSIKVKIVNILRGKKNTMSLVKERGGRWVANRVFVVPINEEHIFERIFLNFKVKFNKFYILIH